MSRESVFFYLSVILAWGGTYWLGVVAAILLIVDSVSQERGQYSQEQFSRPSPFRFL